MLWNGERIINILGLGGSAKLARTIQSVSLAGLLFLAAGCGGGNAGVAGAEPVTAPPTSMAMQPNTFVQQGANSEYVSQCIAVRGTVLYVGNVKTGEQAVWDGKQVFPFKSNLSNASVDCANLRHALGGYNNSSGDFACFIWQYRIDGTVIPLPNCVNLGLAKNSDVFYDQEIDRKTYNSVLYLLTVQGSHLTRVPYKIPPGTTVGESTLIEVTKSGLALVRTSFGDAASVNKHVALRARSFPFKHTVEGPPDPKTPVSTAPTPSGYYLLSTMAEPVEVFFPAGTSEGFFNGLNDQGICVGYVYGLNSSGTEFLQEPYWWDAKGQPHPLPLPSSETQGIAWDINDSGTVVGDISGPPSYRGAMWPNVNSTPVDVNSLLTNFPYYVGSVQSIGEDSTMFAVCQPSAESYSNLYYLGLKPAAARNSGPFAQFSDRR